MKPVWFHGAPWSGDPAGISADQDYEVLAKSEHDRRYVSVFEGDLTDAMEIATNKVMLHNEKVFVVPVRASERAIAHVRRAPRRR
jgi:hypothetical protein